MGLGFRGLGFGVWEPGQTEKEVLEWRAALICGSLGGFWRFRVREFGV